jgi:phosphocarrier protein HPr
MLEAKVVLGNRLGLHARAAAKVVRAAKDFESSITLVAENGTQADAKSILSILALAAGKGTRLTLIADGSDEASAIDDLQKLFANNFDEEQ